MLVESNGEGGSDRERYGAAFRAEGEAPLRSNGRPLASNGNEAIGAKSKGDTSDSPVAAH